MVLNDSTHVLKTFSELSTNELYEILKLRSQVFVLEQDCAYQDVDDLDQEALHLYRINNHGGIAAYARIVQPEQSSVSHCSIGRVVVNEKHRHEKLGHALMLAAIEVTKNKFPAYPLKISAQTYLTGFYEELGFTNTGNFYLEDQIPHQEMLYQSK